MINRIVLTGQLAADPETRYTTNETPVTRFSIAIPSHIDPQDNVFVNIVAWGGLAKICGEYLSKGKAVCIEGKLQIRTYEKNGEKRSLPEVIANNIQLLDIRTFKKMRKEVANNG